MNFPDKFIKNMKELLGDEFQLYIDAMQEKRQYGLRINTSKISPEEFEKISPFEIKKIPWIKNGYFYHEDVQPAKHPYYFAGLYYLQEPSAMTPASRLPVEEGDCVLDLCAAPGGKATELGARLKGTGLLVANDISSSRAKALLKNIELFGIKNVFIVTETPAKLEEQFHGFFDKILIDAPCSGEGMFRKDPAIMKAWEKNGNRFYADLQREIVDQAIKMLKPGGMILYSTCTFCPDENEGTIQYLLDRNPDIHLTEIEGYEGFACGMPETIENGSEELKKCVRIFPHKMKGEGHFLALLKKEEEGMCDSVEQRERSRLGKEEKKSLDEFLVNVTMDIDVERLECKASKIYYMPEKMPELRGMHFLRNGLLLGECKKNRFEPSQSFAMALKKNEYKNVWNLKLNDERVIRYLKGETIQINEEDQVKESGWYLICVDTFPLGWGKVVGNMLKNKYHAGWRWI